MPKAGTAQAAVQGHNPDVSILVAPLHHYFRDGGSEYGWAYEYATQYPQPLAVVVANNDAPSQAKSPQVFECYKGHYRANNLSRVVFHIRCFLSARRLLSPDVHVVHHYMPFEIGTTFNLLPILGYTKTRRFVVGPIQASHTFTDKAESGDSWLAGLAKKPFKVLCRLTLDKADVVLAVNDAAKQKLVEFGVSPSKIRIIPRGIDLTRFKPSPKPHDGVLKIITVGYLYKRKGMELVLRAVHECKKNGKAVHLDIVGDGVERPNLERLIDELGLANDVKMHGLVNHKQVQDAYSRAHVFVSMSRSEAFATVPLEAMACGLPILGTATGGFAETITDGENGYLIAQEDYMGLAGKLSQLADKPSLVSKMASAARATVEQHYDWHKNIIPEYLKAYERQ